jgi:ADP-ribose pyrophosphatase YjhB (NUDIX family)
VFPVEAFRCCPSCGAARPESDVGTNPLRCGDCGFTFFFNPTIAAGAFLFDAAGRCLFIRRANEPAKGTLAVPGGFVDVGESLEVALPREIREEVGLTVTHLRYVCSAVNEYPYAGVTYWVVDCIFAAEVSDPASARPLDAVAGIEWHRIEDVGEEELAFPSIRIGRRVLLSGKPA